MIIDGIKFTEDKVTGYYLSSRRVNGKRIRVHRYMWEKYNGNIPKGFHIHHIDHDKSNNDIINLELLQSSKHLSYHSKDNNMLIIQPLAVEKSKEWHKSNDGLEWHKQQYLNTKDKLHNKITRNCDFCNKEYISINNGKNRFCHNNCKSANRRKMIKEGLL